MITEGQCSWTGVQPQKKDDLKENQTFPSNCANLSAQLTSPLLFCSTWQRTSKLIPLVRSTPKTSIPTCHTSLSAFPPTVSLARSSCCFGLLFCFFFSSEGCLSKGLFKDLTKLLTAVSGPLWRRNVQHTRLRLFFGFLLADVFHHYSFMWFCRVQRITLRIHLHCRSYLQLEKWRQRAPHFNLRNPLRWCRKVAHTRISRVVEPQGVTASSWNTGKFTPPPTFKSERCE